MSMLRFFLFFCIFSPYLLLAQSSKEGTSAPLTDSSTIDQDDSYIMEDVVITGTMRETYISQSPIKVSVISSKYLKQHGSPTNIVEGMSLINGIEEVVECGVCGTNSLRINGLEGPYTAVLIDGTPMFGNLASVYGLNGIPTSMIERIEVIKGPNSTLYGSEAVAGVINVITENPAHQPLISANIQGTSLGEWNGNISFAPRIGNWDGTVGIDYGMTHNFIDEVQDGFGDLVNHDRLSLFTKWSKRRADAKKFFIAAKYYTEDRRNGVEAFLTDGAHRQLRGSDQVYGESILTDRAELFGTYEFSGNQSLKLDYSFSHHAQDSYYGSDFYEATQQIAFANLIWNKPIQKHYLTTGTTFRYQSYDDNTIATETEIENLPDRQFIPGIFVQDEWEPSKRFTLLAGSRLDYYSAHGLIFAPRLNLKYKPGDWTTYRLNAGTGFRVVNLFTEDHAFVSGQRNIEIQENLDPERSYNLAFNLNHVYTTRVGQGILDIDAFYTHFLNKIIPDYDTPGKIIYSNADGHAVSKGISLSLSHSFSPSLKANIGLTMQRVTQTERGENGDLQTSPIPFAPDLSSTGTLSYDWKGPNLLLSWSFNLTGPMELPTVYDLDEAGNLLPFPRATRSQTWARHNFQISKDIPSAQLSIYGGVKNIFDFRQPISPLVGFQDPQAAPGFSEYFDTIYAYAPLTGRNWFLGIRWNLKKK